MHVAYVSLFVGALVKDCFNRGLVSLFLRSHRQQHSAEDKTQKRNWKALEFMKFVAMRASDH